MSKWLSGAIAVFILTTGDAGAQDQKLIAAAKTTLAGIQPNSFIADREYCGMIGRNEAGNIVITRPRKGRRDSCLPREFRDANVEVLASYHTHGSYDIEADAEVPSLDDVDADREEQVLGFISTPGGRFWMTDYRNGTIKQICGIGCLPKDPDFEEGVAGEIPRRFSRRQLRHRERGE